MSPRPPQLAPQDLTEGHSWRRAKDRLATSLMVAALVVTMIPLGFILFTVISKGAGIISWQFLTGTIASFKMPKDLVVVPELPRNAGGKVVKGVLRTQDRERVEGVA